MYKSIVFILTVFAAGLGLTKAQPGGNYTYNFLNLTNSARAASLGGDVIAIQDDDFNLTAQNPSLLNSNMSNNLVMNYVNYFTDINYGYFSYAHSFANAGNFAAAVNYINYGEFTAADYTGVITGHFRAAEYSFNLMWSMPLDSSFTVGAALKTIHSVLEQYTSTGLATDVGITYHNPDKLFTAAFVIRNLGTQVKAYNSGNMEPLPLNIELGISQRLKYAPFRFSLTAHHLQQWDMLYTTEADKKNSIDPLTGEKVSKSKAENFAENFMRHMIVGVEFLPMKNFYFRVGYNYQRRKEMQLASKVGGVGFSWGFGLKISKFNISYGRATYHLSGASNLFSLTTNISDFYQKGK